MKLVNLTPHAVRVILPDGSEKVFQPSGTVARVRTEETPSGELEGIPLVSRAWAGLEMPEPEPGVVFLVSSLVLEAAKAAGREDVVAPDTGATAVRENGQVVAVRRLVR